MTRSHFIEMLMILTKYVFDLGVWLTEFSVTVESVTLSFYCISSDVIPPRSACKCLQILYQSVAINLKYMFLVLLLVY